MIQLHGNVSLIPSAHFSSFHQLEIYSKQSKNNECKLFETVVVVASPLDQTAEQRMMNNKPHENISGVIFAQKQAFI